MKDEDVVIIGQQAWDLGIGSNAHNLATEFALENKVVYVNPPLDIKTSLSLWKDEKVRNRLKIIFGIQEKLVQIKPNLYVYTPGILCLSINWIISKRLFKFLNKFNNNLFAKSIRKATKILEFKDFILFNDCLMFLGLYQKKLLEPKKYVYYLRDYLIYQGYFKKHGIWAEAKVIESADLVLTNSDFLRNYALKFNANSYNVGQGCEIELFNPKENLEIPSDLALITKPIIGYVGNMTSERLDIDLLYQISKRYPKFSVVMVGFEDKAFAESKLHRMPNVHFLGKKTPKQIPAYIKYFDVSINPQLINDLTIGNYPRKIDEYLAMGKPVVATATEAMEMFRPFVYLANTHSEYIELIEKAYLENDSLKEKDRIEFARGHSWKVAIQAIYSIVDQKIVNQFC